MRTNPNRRAYLAAIMATLAGSTVVSQASGKALDYPNKLVRFVVPFPAGSATDQAARLLAAQLTRLTGGPVVIENRAGASGILGADAVAKATPDGYTILITTGTTHAANPSLFKRLPYDPVADFSPVSTVSSNTFMLVVAPDFPAKNVAELVRLVKPNPGKFSFASGNAPSRIGGELFKIMAGVDMIHVPYKGAPPALIDVMGGQVSMMWTDLATGLPLIESGKLKALATTGHKRTRAAVQLPTMIEEGFPQYVLANWVAVYLPAKTPQKIVARLNELVHAAVKADTKGHELGGAELRLSSPAELAQLQLADAAMWARVTKSAGIEKE